jgi:tRNA/tmRNA/rRNA uracil-C5-methylase (TrmA/RlmC/RlmD family)
MTADADDPADAIAGVDAIRGADAIEPTPTVGQLIVLDVGPVAHGGHCVARWDGRVVFVRHALPGERAVVRLTDTSHAGYFRGDAIDILAADPRRVTPRCSHFRPGGCGGCDFQHADPQLQLELKAAVVAEQLSRLAGIERTVTVQPLPGNRYGWRTRVRWALDEAGRIGPRAARSHQVVAVSGSEPCEIAADGLSEMVALIDVPPGIRGKSAERRTFRGSGRAGTGDGNAARRQAGAGRRSLPEVTLARTPDGDRIAVWDRATAPTVTETVAGRRFSVVATGFWQVHPEAASALSGAVDEALDGIDLLSGTGWDLYGGVGLFAVPLAAKVGRAGRVLTVENDAVATQLAASNLNDLPQASAVTATVEQLLDDPAEQVDAVVLDPPRSGAGRAVCAALAGRRPRVIVYVACDPAALARDTAVLAEHGYRLDTLRAFDCFPQTQHIECVARFLPAE